METEHLFLTHEQAIKAIQLDFRGYGPQPMLFCQVLRTLCADELPFKRDPAADAVWVGGAGQGKMRRLEGSALVEFMCALLDEADPDSHTLAMLCRQVFQAPCEATRDSAGCRGILIQIDMTSFQCVQCGHCCSRLDYHDGITADDVARLRELDRGDILKWIGITRKQNGQTGYRIWVTPGTNQFAVPCPFLKPGPSPDTRICSIHEVKPSVCRNYPVSRKHALMTGCPGFDKKAGL